MNKIEILLINNDDSQFKKIKDLLNEIPSSNHTINIIDEKKDLNSILFENEFDIYLIDYNYIKNNKIDIKDDILCLGNYYSFIILYSNIDINSELNLLNFGNYDFINLNKINSELLDKTINFSINRKFFIQERELLLDVINEKNEELQDLVYTISHDIRSPLLNIKGFSQEFSYAYNNLNNLLNKQKLLKDSNILEIKENFETSIKYINQSIEKIENLLNGLLIVSRLGTKNLEIDKINIKKLINEVLKNIEILIVNKNISITIDKNIPDCKGDHSLLNQVFTNLITNAVKYLDTNRKGLITISGYMEKDSTIYFVEDNGIGIEEQNFKSIFKIFHKINKDERIKGEGLGLSIVKKILNKHNGKVWVESIIDKGSKFYISIPNKIS